MTQHGAYILARYSTDRQNPDSIEVQVQKCTDWCQKEGLPILGIYADYAVSGMKDTRPQQSRMMDDLRMGGADTVVIYDQSRMFRKMTAWFEFRAELETMGATVISVTQPQIGGDLRDPTNFLTEGSMALFNQIWALQTRQKVIAKMEFMARQGLHTGGVPPLGYHIRDGHLEIQEDEAATVRRIFEEYASGKTYKGIIDGLNADGIRTRGGKQFGSNSLHDLLKNERYIGTLTYGRAPRRPDGRRNSHGAVPDGIIRLEHAIPAIINQETWDAVQAKLMRNRQIKAGRPGSARDYPLRGKVYCELCKKAMIISTSTNASRTKYYYYACSGKQRLHNCDLQPIRADELEHHVATAVRSILGNPHNMGRLMQILRDERDKLTDNAATKLQALVDRKSEVSRQLDAATDAVLQGLVSPTLRAKIQGLEAEKAKLDMDMRQLKQDVTASRVPEEQLQKILDTIINAGTSDDTILLSVVSRVEVGPEFITIWTILDTDQKGELIPTGETVPVSLGDTPPAPRWSKLYVACSDFFQKSERAHAAAPPFQIEPTSLGFDLVLGTGLKERHL